MRISKGFKNRARKIMIIGVHGGGKSSLAAQAPNPFFFDFEEGTDSLDVYRNESPITSTSELIGGINWLLHNEHDRFSVVLDTVDWCNDNIVTKNVRGGKPLNEAKGGFGKGKEAVADDWHLILAHLDNLRRVRNIGTILLAHAKVTKVNDPIVGTYDKYTSDMPEGLDGLLQEWADEVFFIRHKVFTRTEELGFNRERTLASTAGEREILTCDSASASAKNRCGLPPVMEFPRTGFWNTYYQYIAKFNQQPASNHVESKPAAMPVEQMAPISTGVDISGIVVDGSSKPPSPEIAEMQQLFAG